MFNFKFTTMKNNEIKAIIKKNFGSVSKLKKQLKESATNEYGNFMSEIKIDGLRFSYTDNLNCFATFLVTIPRCGTSVQYALGKQSLTASGLKRGCEKYYIDLK